MHPSLPSVPCNMNGHITMALTILIGAQQLVLWQLIGLILRKILAMSGAETAKELFVVIEPHIADSRRLTNEKN